jgi:hypothetical protein
MQAKERKSEMEDIVFGRLSRRKNGFTSDYWLVSDVTWTGTSISIVEALRSAVLKPSVNLLRLTSTVTLTGVRHGAH